MNELQAYKKNTKGTFGLKSIYLISWVTDSVKTEEWTKIGLFTCELKHYIAFYYLVAAWDRFCELLSCNSTCIRSKWVGCYSFFLLNAADA